MNTEIKSKPDILKGKKILSTDIGHSSIEIYFTDGTILCIEADTIGMDAGTIFLSLSMINTNPNY